MNLINDINGQVKKYSQGQVKVVDVSHSATHTTVYLQGEQVDLNLLTGKTIIADGNPALLMNDRLLVSRPDATPIPFTPQLPHGISLPYFAGYDLLTNEPLVTDLATAPHLLIAGTSGGGKSTALYAFVSNLLYWMTTGELSNIELVALDPKRVDFKAFAGLPCFQHYTNYDDMVMALMVLEHVMEERYKLLENNGVLSLVQYNAIDGIEPIPQTVIIVDECQTFLGKNTDSLAPLKTLSAQGRAVGMHLVLATQSPRADNLPTAVTDNCNVRTCYAVPKHTASNVVLGVSGAELLQGKGSCLTMIHGKLHHVQSALISPDAVANYVTNAAHITPYGLVLPRLDNQRKETNTGTIETDINSHYPSIVKPVSPADALYERAVESLTSFEIVQVNKSVLKQHLNCTDSAADKVYKRLNANGYFNPRENGAQYVTVNSDKFQETTMALNLN